MKNQHITFLKTQHFITSYPIILFFQHNNLPVKQWFEFRNQVKQLDTSDVLVLKNTFVEKVLRENPCRDAHNVTQLFQGPCFALGFQDGSKFQEISNLTNRKFSFFLLGGIFNKEVLNHLDIAKMMELDSSVYTGFLANLNQSQQLDNVLSVAVSNPCGELAQVAENLLYCLEVLKSRKQDILIVYV